MTTLNQLGSSALDDGITTRWRFVADFADKHGDAVAYCDDETHVYFYSGEAVAYLDAGAVYSYPGAQLGWCELGWVRDKDGRCVAFSEYAIDGPPRPLTRQKPPRAETLARPPKEKQDPRALRPIHSNAWSQTAARVFFQRYPTWQAGQG